MKHGTPNDRHVGVRARHFNIAIIAFLAVAVFYLLTAHYAHVYGVLPWFLFAGLLSLHFWIHGETGHSRRDGSSA